MKKQVHPAVMTLIIAIFVAGAAFFLWRVAGDKPAYPGLNAGKPAGEVAGANQAAVPAGRAVVPSDSVTTEQASKMHIPGMVPGSKPPGQQ